MDNNLPAGRQEFKTVVLGGTFDHLHKGHKEFIRFSLNLSEKLIIGLTSDEYVRKSKGESLESYDTRKKALDDFLEKEGVEGRAEIVKINDVYGPAISREYNFDALLVVEKTLKGAGEVNTKRKSLGFYPLEVIVAPSIKAEDGKTIASSRIRSGEIDREGKLYINPQWLNHNLIMPDSLREELKQPFGKLISQDSIGSSEEPLIAVGDITTQEFNKLSLNQKISIIDFNVARKRKFSQVSDLGFSDSEEIIKVENPAGRITSELFLAIIKAFSKSGKVIIKVLGEEDLAVLPAVLAAPLNATVFYGQPGEGIVKVPVSEEIKQKAYRLLTEFNRSS